MVTRQKRPRMTKAPEDRRREIMDAAVHLFAQKGIQATTVSEIAEAAGVAKGTFYLYFQSKEYLLGGLRERFVEDMVASAEVILARVGQEDWWTLLDDAMEATIDFMLERRETFQFFAREEHSPEVQGLMAECERKLNHFFISGIQLGVAAGAFSVEDPEMAGTFLHHAIEGAVLSSLLYGGQVDRDRLVATASGWARKALAP
jgi:AcrR family transcriptional regulator